MVHLRTEVQDYEYLKNGKRYQKMSQNIPPKNMPIYVYLHCLTWSFLSNFELMRRVTIFFFASENIK